HPARLDRRQRDSARAAVLTQRAGPTTRGRRRCPTPAVPQRPSVTNRKHAAHRRVTSPPGRAFRPVDPQNKGMVHPGFTPTQLSARAAYLLRGNDLGTMTSAAPRLYPHMWSWDAAFVTVGLAPLSVERAVVELDTLLSAQWKNGMIPHIVFANGVDGY